MPLSCGWLEKKCKPCWPNTNFFCIAPRVKISLTSPFWVMLTIGYLPYKARLVFRGILKILWALITYWRNLFVSDSLRNIKGFHLRPVTMILNCFEVDKLEKWGKKWSKGSSFGTHFGLLDSKEILYFSWNGLYCNIVMFPDRFYKTNHLW